MKSNIINEALSALSARLALAVGSTMLLVSCGAQMGGYSETDGVYYDPETDTIPEGVITGREGNQIDEYYDYDAEVKEESIIAKNRKNQLDQKVRKRYYRQVPDSDWGNYAGTETNYYSDWGWGSPFWNFSPFGYNGFGFGFGWSSGFGWGSPFYGSPYFGFGYSPWHFGYSSWYAPYYGMYHPWGWGMGYYDWYGMPYYGNYNPYPYRQSGPTRGFVGAPVNGVLRQPVAGSFRNGPVSGNANVERGFRNRPDEQRTNGGFRNGSRYPGQTIDASAPRGGFRQPMGGYEQAPRPSVRYESAPNYNGGGFRNGSSGFGGGSMPSGGGGGFRGGSSGGSRSGGFR